MAPDMKMFRLSVFILFILAPLNILCAQECSDCHERYKKTNHGNLACIVCHNDAKELPHPEKLKKPDCALCHQGAVKKYNISIHRQKNLDCRGCHDIHTPAPGSKKCASCHIGVTHKSLPSAKKHLAALDCTGCHAKTIEGQIAVRIDSRQPMVRTTVDKDRNNFVDEKEWKDFLAHTQSVAKDTYSIKRKYSARGSMHDITAKAISCNACHVQNKVFQKATLEAYSEGQYMRLALDPHGIIPRLPTSDLYALTSHGKGGVSCRDCHVSQGRISDAICAKCHEKVYGIYKGTKHAKGGAANCTDCHDPHKVQTYREMNNKERIAVCVKCHGDYKKRHTWLPHTELHFMYLECSTCHSPESDKGMAFNLNIQTRLGQRKLDHDDIVAAFGGKRSTKEYIDKNGDWRVSSSELVPFLQALESSTKGKVAIDSSILVTKIHHDYSQVQKRDRVCATCHSNDAPIYQSMYLVLPEADGQTRIAVKGTVLSAVPSSLAVNVFLLGETKIRWSDIRALLDTRGEARREVNEELGFKWIDIAGLFLIFAIFMLIVIHIIFRVVFRR
ncbi:MAG: cytochrome c3 family protein [Syntrophorhabdaceae bacterium]